MGEEGGGGRVDCERGSKRMPASREQFEDSKTDQKEHPDFS